jgi:restriction system protein
LEKATVNAGRKLHTALPHVDLYGTVINEGANRGILVSTADYGPDAYEFVKGKPLTLLGGANLLQLLADHGNKARMDLKEAKTFNRAEKESARH